MKMAAHDSITIHEPVAGLHPLPHLLRGVWLQALRRKEIYVMAILMGLYVLAALVLRLVGIGTAQTARFIAGLGLQLGSTLAALLVIVMGARQLPAELEQRTIYPVLAKPVTRFELLAGKALPTWLTGAAALILFTIATLAITPRLPYQLAPVLIQALALEALGLAMLTAMVFCLALALPTAVAMLLAALVYFCGAPVANMLAQVCGGGALAHALAGLLPDFTLLDHFARYVDGGAPLSLPALAGMVTYGAVWTAIFAGLATTRFKKMAL